MFTLNKIMSLPPIKCELPPKELWNWLLNCMIEYVLVMLWINQWVVLINKVLDFLLWESFGDSIGQWGIWGKGAIHTFYIYMYIISRQRENITYAFLGVAIVISVMIEMIWKYNIDWNDSFELIGIGQSVFRRGQLNFQVGQKKFWSE